MALGWFEIILIVVAIIILVWLIKTYGRKSAKEARQTVKDIAKEGIHTLEDFKDLRGEVKDERKNIKKAISSE